MKEAEKSLLLVAEEYSDKWKMSDDPPDFRFFYTGKDDDNEVPKSLRTFTNLPESNPLLVIIDIPSQMVYRADGELNVANVRTFVQKFFDNDLSGKKLQS